MASDTDTRRLAQSSMYDEDVLHNGHRASWGSFYSVGLNRWGYACCRATQKSDTCILWSAAREREPESEEDLDEEVETETDDARRRWHEDRLLDGPPPSSVEPRGVDTTDEDHLLQFVLFWFHQSAEQLKLAKQEAKVRSMREALLPLLHQLQRRTVHPQLLANLVEFVDLAGKKEYAAANDVYIAMTIGKALWHSDLDLGQQRAHWAGCNLRTMQRQVVEKDRTHATLFDSDPVVQRYVHAMKRLVTFMQERCPGDPSKLGHAPAPSQAEYLSETQHGTPVRYDHCSYGQGLPEFAEPGDPRHCGASGSRGLLFGERTDRTGMGVSTGRNSHPFAAP